MERFRNQEENPLLDDDEDKCKSKNPYVHIKNIKVQKYIYIYI